MKLIKLVPLMAVVLLAGCQSRADRMYKCESQGIDRDTCYAAEENRDNTNRAAMNGAAMKQAMENAQGLYGINGSETGKHKHHHHHNED